VTYNDLMELARLCLWQAGVARTPAAADELRRMPSEYLARAAALTGGQLPDIAKAFAAPAPEAPSSTVRAATAAARRARKRRYSVPTRHAETP
jgi:hypothetical protein